MQRNRGARILTNNNDDVSENGTKIISLDLQTLHDIFEAMKIVCSLRYIEEI